ncbi:hypothetical protein ACVHYJ_19640 [Burkholderia pyrrocinia]|uniref:hypothetical protein n=1 Tax=Burkholderia pyrrocinia TaxID=60550 RepID=UPI00126A50AA|nr:hypothetical protein [Burkholderia pyrrocinia]
MFATGMQIPNAPPQIGTLGTIIAAHVDLGINRHAPQIQAGAAQREEAVADRQQFTVDVDFPVPSRDRLVGNGSIGAMSGSGNFY